MSEKRFGHMVYFSLNDRASEACHSLVEGCQKYLAGHDDIDFFACGILADTHREVNDREFDVSLHIVFSNRAAHDSYQIAPRHDEFIAEFKDNWAHVRVFDTEMCS